MPQGGHGPLDEAALARLRTTMGGEYRSMLEEFVAASSRVHMEFRAAVAAQRGADAERAAHTLKSMAHMVGARTLAHRCAALEARHGHAAPGDLAALARDVAEAQEAVLACLA